MIEGVLEDCADMFDEEFELLGLGQEFGIDGIEKIADGVEVYAKTVGIPSFKSPFAAKRLEEQKKLDEAGQIGVEKAEELIKTNKAVKELADIMDSFFTTPFGRAKVATGYRWEQPRYGNAGYKSAGALAFDDEELKAALRTQEVGELMAAAASGSPTAKTLFEIQGRRH